LEGTHKAACGTLEERIPAVKRLVGHDATLDQHLDARNP
jgi:hypothetical protein